MTGWIIFGSIVLFLVWLFTRCVTVVLDYGERFDVKIKFLFIKLFPTKPKKKKAKAVKAKINADEENAEADGSAENIGADGGKGKNAPKKPKKKLGIDPEQIVEYVKSASPPVKRLFRKIKFTGLYLNYIVGTDDAAKTAIKYGGLCAAVYPFLEWLCEHFTVRIKKISIAADFSREKDDITAHCKIKLRVSTAIGCALWLAVRIIKTYLKYNGKAKTKAKPVKA